MRLVLIATFAFLFMSNSSAWAARGGGGAAASLSGGSMAMGLMAGIVNTSQDDMNTLITRANQRAGGISTGQLNQAYEGSAFFMDRISGSMFALQLRPSYFYQSQTGTDSSGNAYNYSVKGFTIFPMLRMYPLENDLMKFYMQIGMGYGQITGEINEGSAVASFTSGGFGSMVGMGAEFCLTPSSCFNFEGDYRYLTFSRSISSGSAGTFATGSLTQYAKGQEIEMDASDLATRMGGLMFMMGYTYWF